MFKPSNHLACASNFTSNSSNLTNSSTPKGKPQLFLKDPPTVVGLAEKHKLQKDDAIFFLPRDPEKGVAVNV